MELTLLEGLVMLTVAVLCGSALKWARRRRWSARSRMKRPIRYLTIPH